MQLGELLKDWPCTMKGSIRTEIKRVEDEASKVMQGDIFVARKGKDYNGILFIEEALANGAVAIVLDDELYFDSIKISVPVVWVPNCLSFLSFANAKVLGFPAEAVTVIAVTGTNGKTTVTHFIGQILNQLQERTMVIGTNGVFVDGKRCYEQFESLTTLQAKNLQFLFYEAIRHDIPYVILEASSIGLVKHRLDYCDIDIGIFLNITEDHIEDHGSFEKYKQAKQILAHMSKKIIINSDDTICRSIGLAIKGKRIFFGKGSHVDYYIQTILEANQYTICCIQNDDEQFVVTLPIVGEYQCSNVLAAISCVAQLQFKLKEICEAVQFLTLPEGRYEVIDNQLGLLIVVDYAHTPDAMKMLLQSVKKQTKERLIVVFSCGGNRDRAKRPKMGMIASAYANYIILTTDNARGEAPQVINEQIRKGFPASQLYEELLDRQLAIEQAIKIANKGDSVVVLGKGHEKTQQIGNVQTFFSDKECVRQALEQFEPSESE